MRLERIAQDFSVCKVNDLSQIDLTGDYCFVCKTDEELSVVCATGRVPASVLVREDGWKAVRIQGVLDFSLIGILAKLLAVLAEQEIGVFVVSTYNTDYVLVKSENYEKALDALAQAGYEIV